MSEFDDADQPIEIAELPSANGKPNPSQPHTQADLLGVTGGGNAGSEISKLLEGSDQFMEWSARGNRTAKERVAEVALVSETVALKNEHFPIRSRFMKGVHQQNALRSLMAVSRPSMSKLEFGLVIAGMATMLVVLFLITTVVAE